MATPLIDPSRYLNPPRVGVRSGISLGRMLLAAVPSEPPPNIAAAAEQLERTVDELAERWSAKVTRRGTEDVRPYDHHLDRAWSTVERGLARYATLGHEHPDRERAAELHQVLFPSGLGFVKLPYIEQHAESELRVQLIAAEGLRDDLDRLVGTLFIDDLLAAHQAYGTILEITVATEQPPSVLLAAPLRALTRAISSYALQVLAFAGLDPEQGPVAQRALEPIEVLRRASARRRASRVEVDPEVEVEVEAEAETEAETEADAELAAELAAERGVEPPTDAQEADLETSAA